MCATVSGTLLITSSTAGMKRMLQHLQQAVNKVSISKVACIIIYLRSLKIFHHNFPLPSSLLEIRKKHHFPKTLFVTKNVTNPVISLKTQAIWQMILEYVSDVRYVSKMFAPIVNHFGLGGPGALFFFSFRPWEVGCLKTLSRW